MTLSKQVFAFACIGLFLLTATAGFATPDKQEQSAGRSAFLFANRKDWPNALAYAKQSHDPVLVKLITWEYLLGSDSGAEFPEITRFIHDNPNWPEQKRLRLRAEFSLRDDKTPDSQIIKWFEGDAPLTGVGKLALAEALARTNPQSDRIDALIRDAWRSGDFDEKAEAKLLEQHSDKLHADDDIARMDRLLWEEKLLAAKRLLPRLSEDEQALAMARMALMEDAPDASSKVDKLSSSQKDTSGVIYDRMRFRVHHNDKDGAREMLLAAPETVPYPEKWWRYRETQIREAIGEQQYDLAKKLLANHGQENGQEFSTANWLKGWLMLEFLHEPEAAYDAFSKMYGSVRYPVSRARAAYWAARAAEKISDKETAKGWYESAAAYPTTFYGQLAALKTNDHAPLKIPAAPDIAPAKKQAFQKDELVRAATLAGDFGERDLAGELINYMIENTDDPATATLAAELGNKMGHMYLSVRGAKKANQQNIILIKAGYPMPATPPSLPIERALTLSIMRQESEFDAKAKSPTGALGMMQLLPGTARETARRNGLAWRIKRLIDPEYNMSLGSYYLGRLVRVYDGSYILGIAAYNAGPGNVRGWVGQFGAPGKDVESAVDWIEKIPFSETRNYVQRVLENLQVYRQIEAANTPNKLDEDLLR